MLSKRLSRFQLEEGMAAPWGWGMAWRDYAREFVVIMPIPLNIVMGVVRRVYLWMLSPWRRSMTKGERACYERGVRDGIKVW